MQDREKFSSLMALVIDLPEELQLSELEYAVLSKDAPAPLSIAAKANSALHKVEIHTNAVPLKAQLASER